MIDFLKRSLNIFISVIFSVHMCVAQSTSNIKSEKSRQITDTENAKFTFQIIQSSVTLDSLANIIAILSGRVSELAALKNKIGTGILNQKLLKIKLDNQRLIIGKDKIQFKNRKIFFNKKEITFDASKTLAENFEVIKLNLKGAKTNYNSGLFNYFIGTADAGDFQNISSEATMGLLATAALIIACGIAVGALMAGFQGMKIAFGLYSAIILATSGIQALGESLNIQNDVNLCQPQGVENNSFKSSFRKQNGDIFESTYTLKDGFLTVLIKEAGKNPRTIIVNPTPGNPTMVQQGSTIQSEEPTKEELEVYFNEYKICADPETRKEVQNRVKAYKKADLSKGSNPQPEGNDNVK